MNGDTARLTAHMRVPVIGSPMFLVSTPALVIAQCKAGVVGSFPALNARSSTLLDEWLHEIREALAAHDRTFPHRPAAPFAINQIVHRSNARLDADLAVMERHRPPLVISSLGADAALFATVRGWGGVALHDVTTTAFGAKALDKGASGLVAVAAGAGGHAGALSPFALVQELRALFDGPLALGGAIATGAAAYAACAMGADFAYMGTAFVACAESGASEPYRRMLLDATSADIVNADLFTGIPANYLGGSIRAAGLDPANLPKGEWNSMSFVAEGSGQAAPAKAWRDIWGAGQGVAAVDRSLTVAELVDRLEREWRDTASRMNLRLPAERAFQQELAHGR
ncbi:nitronate monooxygenase family protein [soil metagenome]